MILKYKNVTKVNIPDITSVLPEIKMQKCLLSNFQIRNKIEIGILQLFFYDIFVLNYLILLRIDRLNICLQRPIEEDPRQINPLIVLIVLDDREHKTISRKCGN